MFPPFKGERGKYKDGKRQVETRDGEAQFDIHSQRQ